MSKKKNIGLVAAGILIGAALSGPTAQAAEIYLQAVPSWQKIYLDGQQVQMTAYNINGSNYVKLRDIGKAVGFNVYWDTVANGVQIDSDAPYTGEAPVTAPTADAILVGSVKGNTLKAGERSRLMIEDAGATYSVSSSTPEVVSVESVLGYWVAVAKAPGTAVITVADGAGRKGTLTLTVEAADPKPAVDLTANMEIRQEMVRLINEVRVQNGVAALPINDALMDAAQDCSAHKFWTHDPYEAKSVQAHGWPYGTGINLTWFNYASDGGVAKHAVDNWVSSSGHFQAMIDEKATCLGVGVTIDGDMAYCYMMAGDPNSVNAQME